MSKSTKYTSTTTMDSVYNIKNTYMMPNQKKVMENYFMECNSVTTTTTTEGK